MGKYVNLKSTVLPETVVFDQDVPRFVLRSLFIFPEESVYQEIKVWFNRLDALVVKDSLVAVAICVEEIKTGVAAEKS